MTVLSGFGEFSLSVTVHGSSVHVLAVRQVHGDVAGGAHADLAALNRPPGLGTLHLDGKGYGGCRQRPPSPRWHCLAIGGPGIAGDGNLTGGIGPPLLKLSLRSVTEMPMPATGDLSFTS